MTPTDKLIETVDLSNPEVSELVKRIETMLRDSKVLWSSVEAGYQVDKSRIEHLTKQLEVEKNKNEALEEDG
ncbi:MAG: hypothetical protein JKY96_02350 [Phycisphaerales bacterium]|nr:hypothetical protein [Phycisphaerales bacterium]